MGYKLNPTVLERKSTENTIQFTLRAGDDIVFFKDHFPAFPLVPGVSQIQWVMNFLPPTFGTFCAINNLKFMRPIVPNTTFCLSIDTHPAEKIANFRYFDTNGNLSSGQIAFE